MSAYELTRRGAGTAASGEERGQNTYTGDVAGRPHPTAPVRSLCYQIRSGVAEGGKQVQMCASVWKWASMNIALPQMLSFSRFLLY